MDQAVESCKTSRLRQHHHRLRRRHAAVGRGHLHHRLPRPRPARHRRRHHHHQEVLQLPRPLPRSPRWREPVTRAGAPCARLTRDWFRVDAPGNDRGALSPAVVILALMIFTLAGLVIDGGRQLGARSRAVGYAQEAARVGAATIDLKVAEAKIDTTKAGDGGHRVLRAGHRERPGRHRAAARSSSTPRTSQVQVDDRQQDHFLGMVGIGNLDATAPARPTRSRASRSRTRPRRSRRSVITGHRGSGRADQPAEPPTISAVPDLDGRRAEADVGPIPIPLPDSCTPNVTPSPTDDPSESPTDKPPGTPPTKIPPTSPPGGGGPEPTAFPRNSVPPTAG